MVNTTYPFDPHKTGRIRISSSSSTSFLLRRRSILKLAKTSPFAAAAAVISSSESGSAGPFSSIDGESIRHSDNDGAESSITAGVATRSTDHVISPIKKISASWSSSATAALGGVEDDDLMSGRSGYDDYQGLVLIGEGGDDDDDVFQNTRQRQPLLDANGKIIDDCCYHNYDDHSADDEQQEDDQEQDQENFLLQQEYS
jgi:hypothetical protein